MKIRNGFVSNSSTSSFCLFGICVDRNDAVKAAKLLDPEFDVEDSYDAGEVIAEKLHLTYSNGPPESDYVYIGRTAFDLKDDETGAQFKQSVRSALSSYFPDEDYSWYSEGWYDG